MNFPCSRARVWSTMYVHVTRKIQSHGCYTPICFKRVVYKLLVGERENKTSSFGHDCLRKTIAKIAIFQNPPRTLNESYCKRVKEI